MNKFFAKRIGCAKTKKEKSIIYYLLFFLQFSIASVFFVKGLIYAFTIQRNGMLATGLDIVFFHYIKLGFLALIVATSIFYIIFEFISRLSFDFEEDIIKIFIFFFWLFMLISYIFFCPF